MTQPDLTPLAERLRDRTSPLAPDDELYDYAHALLCGALGKALEQVGEVFDPPGDVPPGAPLLDVDLCPDWALPWLAQIVGVSVPSGATADQARALIRDVAGWQRGTPAALRAATQAFLTGSKTVVFRERDGGDPYALEVVTLTSETPDPARTLAALLAQKPGGLVLRYRQVDVWDYQSMTDAGGTYATQSSQYRDYTNLRFNTKG